ncbi:MAG: NAD(+) synthase [Dehalococcoidia bacterium]|nr:NAD(+) synthase [Dehalococcoidia bacterium]
MEELANKIIAWMREQVALAKRKGVVFGLSGGLDSAVVAVLCKRAFPDNALALIMPCYSSETDIEHAGAVAKQFHIPTSNIALEGVIDSLLRVLSVGDYEPDTKKLAEANLKPRLRMLTLYYLANRLGYLVVGSGNRSEISIGYFTKYGDGGVDILPLGNLVKSQVRELAIHLDIPKEIVEKPPSAGLWAGQTDEGEMGITYEELDRYLIAGEAGDEVKKKVDAMIAASAHKRVTPAIPPF